MLHKAISLLVAFTLLFSSAMSQAAETMKATTNISNEHGTLLAWQENSARHFRSKYIAPNGVSINIDVTHSRLVASIGDKSIESTRSKNGDISVIYRNGDASEVLRFTAEQIKNAPSANPALMLDDASLAQLTDEELSAFESLTAFAQQQDQVPQLRCALNLTAFYLITGGAIAGCIGSGGLLCVVGIAGAYQSFDAALAACGAAV